MKASEFFCAMAVISFLLSEFLKNMSTTASQYTLKVQTPSLQTSATTFSGISVICFGVSTVLYYKKK